MPQLGKVKRKAIQLTKMFLRVGMVGFWYSEIQLNQFSGGILVEKGSLINWLELRVSRSVIKEFANPGDFDKISNAQLIYLKSFKTPDFKHSGSLCSS